MRLAVIGASVALVVASAVSAAAETRVRFVLDWAFQGIHGMFTLAEDSGHFAKEGLAVKIDRPGFTSIALTSEYAVPSIALPGSAASEPPMTTRTRRLPDRIALPRSRAGHRAAQRAPHPTPNRAHLLSRSRTTKSQILKKHRKAKRKNLRRREIVVTPFARFASQARKRSYENPEFSGAFFGGFQRSRARLLSKSRTIGG